MTASHQILQPPSVQLSCVSSSEPETWGRRRWSFVKVILVVIFLILSFPDPCDWSLLTMKFLFNMWGQQRTAAGVCDVTVWCHSVMMSQCDDVTVCVRMTQRSAAALSVPVWWMSSLSVVSGCLLMNRSVSTRHSLDLWPRSVCTRWRQIKRSR